MAKAFKATCALNAQAFRDVDSLYHYNGFALILAAKLLLFVKTANTEPLNKNSGAGYEFMRRTDVGAIASCCC